MTLQTHIRYAKYATYYDATDATKVLKAMQWASKSNGTSTYSPSVAYVG